MPIAITCPSCEASYKLADNMRGKKVICRECKSSIIVTSGGTAKRDEDGGHGNRAVKKPNRFRCARRFMRCFAIMRPGADLARTAQDSQIRPASPI